MNGLVLNIKWQEKKKGTHGSECTWCAGAGQNEGDHMVREQTRELTDRNRLGVPGSVRTELAIWNKTGNSPIGMDLVCRVHQNGARHMVRT